MDTWSESSFWMDSISDSVSYYLVSNRVAGDEYFLVVVGLFRRATRTCVRSLQ